MSSRFKGRRLEPGLAASAPLAPPLLKGPTRGPDPSRAQLGCHSPGAPPAGSFGETRLHPGQRLRGKTSILPPTQIPQHICQTSEGVSE